MTFENETLYFIAKTLICIIGTIFMMFSCASVNATRKKIAIVFGIYFVWILLATFFIITVLGIVAMIRLIVIYISVPAMIALYRISEYSPWQAVFNYAVQLSIALVLVMTQTLLSNSMLSDMIVRISSFAVVVIAERLILCKPMQKLNYLADKEWRNLSAVPMAFVLLLIFIASYPGHYLESPERIIYIYVVTLIMFIVYIVLFYSLFTQYRLQMAEHSNSMLKQQAKALEKHIDTINETGEQLRRYRHDMRFHLQGIAGLIKNGETDAALELISGVDEKLDKLRFRKYCSNKAVNAVLSYYLEVSEEIGIKTDVQFAMPEHIQMDIIDFTAIIANALENAVNACLKIADTSERKIMIRVINEPQYIIEISNTYSDMIIFGENGLPTSDEKGHGIGLKSISALAERNSAIIGCNADSKWFKLWIAVPVSKKISV